MPTFLLFFFFVESFFFFKESERHHYVDGRKRGANLFLLFAMSSLSHSTHSINTTNSIARFKSRHPGKYDESVKNKQEKEICAKKKKKLSAATSQLS